MVSDVRVDRGPTAGSPPTGGLRGAVARIGSGPGPRLIGLAVVILALSWPLPAAPITSGLDPSWEIGLHLATWLDLRQGVDLVFTYGPLGFLVVVNPYLGGTTLLALILALVIYSTLLVILLVAARRILPWWAAAIVVLVVARTFVVLRPPEAMLALAVVVCFELLADRRVWPPLLVCVGLGAAAGFAALGKMNIGLFVAGMAALTAMAVDRRWWRGLVTAGGTGLLTAGALWLVTGQRLGDVPAYVSGAIQIANGYSESMGADRDPHVLWFYLAFLGCAALTGWTAWRASEDWPTRRRVGVLAVCALVGFATWKVAFVRGGAPYALGTLLMLVAVAGSRLGDRAQWFTSLLAIGIALIGSAQLPPVSYLDVVGSVRSLAVEVATEVVPGRPEKIEQRNRALLRAEYGIDSVTLAFIAGKSVSIDPDEIGVAYAYPEIRWAPLPVFQSYSAYTAELDRLNANRLASAAAPDRILRRVSFRRQLPDWLAELRGRPLQPGDAIPVVLDGRNRWFEAPAAMLEMFCRYRQLSSIGGWQVLGRATDSCRPPQPLQTIQARSGETIKVPVETRADRFVIVRVHGLEPSLTDQIQTTLWKADQWYVTLDGIRYRLVAPTAVDGLLMAVPDAADGTGEFAFGPPVGMISIDTSRGSSRRTLTYEFLSVPFQP